ncbi:MAG TPA: MarR family winged helix-turn-helix transcriptional regulator [Acidobacteriaceae bacterium]|jgi:DNA-binding MarR family transcriptional regulator|nr:MarR family winged helix-turn-helix transcriptional regulator [Acidobacteriaceae bacterium]
MLIKMQVQVVTNTESQRAGIPSQSAVLLPCACANLRKAALIATQFYDGVLRPSRIRTTQFTLLQALSYAPGISQKKLAELLGIDSTTLTRTLASLRRKGWLRSEAGTDRRALQLSLTREGKREYKRVLPYWQSAQRRLRRALGEENWQQMMNAAAHIAGIKLKL